MVCITDCYFCSFTLFKTGIISTTLFEDHTSFTITSLCVHFGLIMVFYSSRNLLILKIESNIKRFLKVNRRCAFSDKPRAMCWGHMCVTSSKMTVYDWALCNLIAPSKTFTATFAFYGVRFDRVRLACHIAGVFHDTRHKGMWRIYKVTILIKSLFCHKWSQIPFISRLKFMIVIMLWINLANIAQLVSC